ncbi:hypothetical protein QBC46DRAFT_408198 [Diplogelasinospora grovesii]|uniref:Uncharacterized protein n=1 Tax=Diplogelasinospora grovesii TaxID=303347 RepID=A0AAN6S599_9PEZI|nr:hypothetical protein QBC46DRAFT_408198 [Diplogelasinospora grovesii]
MPQIAQYTQHQAMAKNEVVKRAGSSITISQCYKPMFSWPCTGVSGLRQPLRRRSAGAPPCSGWSCLSNAEQVGIPLVGTVFIFTVGFIYWYLCIRQRKKARQRRSPDEEETITGEELAIPLRNRKRSSDTVQGGTRIVVRLGQPSSDEELRVERLGESGHRDTGYYMAPPHPPPIHHGPPHSVVPHPLAYSPPILIVPETQPRPPSFLDPRPAPDPNVCGCSSRRTRDSSHVSLSSVKTDTPSLTRQPSSVECPPPEQPRLSWFSRIMGLPPVGRAHTISDSGSPVRRTGRSPIPVVHPPSSNGAKTSFSRTSSLLSRPSNFSQSPERRSNSSGSVNRSKNERQVSSRRHNSSRRKRRSTRASRSPCRRHCGRCPVRADCKCPTSSTEAASFSALNTKDSRHNQSVHKAQPSHDSLSLAQRRRSRYYRHLKEHGDGDSVSHLTSTTAGECSTSVAERQHRGKHRRPSTPEPRQRRPSSASRRNWDDLFAPRAHSPNTNTRDSHREELREARRRLEHHSETFGRAEGVGRGKSTSNK